MTRHLNSIVDFSRVLLEKVVELPRNIKQACMLSLDMVFVAGAMWAAIALRYGHLQFQLGIVEYACGVVTIIASAIVFLRLGLYRAVIRFMGQQALWAIVTAVCYSTLLLGATLFFSRAEVPRSTPFIFWGLLLLGIGGSRLLVRAYYHARILGVAENVVIYGAGQAGRQLLQALHQDSQYRPVAFVDDSSYMQRTVINGLPVAKPEDLEQIIEQHDIRDVLLAIPSASPERRKEIINSLVGLPVHVRTVPTISELLAGEASVNQIRDIDLDDLLGREPVPSHPEFIERCITRKVVMVTGAGGSIGSELCRQIIVSGPLELILLDNSEYALYSIEQELRATMASLNLDLELVPLLGSVRDQNRLENIYRTFAVATVYHAAAYKHVPLVEYNMSEGVSNNVFGTWSAAEAARLAGVETFVLVSTDKAVRPTNIMGASKRFAELILQGLAQRETDTRFCIVRFGNVLGSSGSVVPKFRQQIEKGGPVTVTHPEVSRYFMSIPEAAQLVLHAGAMSTGGDVFVLDMGEPVRIIDLARRMIQLSGYETHRDEGGSRIEIEYVGLRPGEKLHEELLLGNNVAGTEHPMIMRAQEECLPYAEIEALLADLTRFCDTMDCDGISAILSTAVSGYGNHKVRYDRIWRKQRELGSGEESVSNVQELFPDNP
jgi:FlaA1/EpsC-like NDP-sugar epimerase